MYRVHASARTALSRPTMFCETRSAAICFRPSRHRQTTHRAMLAQTTGGEKYAGKRTAVEDIPAVEPKHDCLHRQMGVIRAQFEAESSQPVRRKDLVPINH